jgi:hypothetical protein
MQHKTVVIVAPNLDVISAKDSTTNHAMALVIH